VYIFVDITNLPFKGFASVFSISLFKTEIIFTIKDAFLKLFVVETELVLEDTADAL
jgi:hypothetical protein